MQSQALRGRAVNCALQLLAAIVHYPPYPRNQDTAARWIGGPYCQGGPKWMHEASSFLIMKKENTE